MSCGGTEGADPGSVSTSDAPSTLVGNPLSLTTGNKRQRETDYAPAGSHLVLQRTYNSTNADHDNGIGQGWHHTYHVVLSAAGENGLEIVQSDGRRLRF